MKIDSSLSVVITGGTSGLGRATVLALRERGSRVAIFDRNKAKGEKLASETGALFCHCDVTSDESVDAAFSKAREENGQERVLVCCAGGANAMVTARADRETGETSIFPSQEFERVLLLNAAGTFRCITRSSAGMMALDPVEGERGVLLNTSSAAATDGQMGQAAYSAGKAAINGMTLTIARDLARYGIRCNTIQPGVFDTPAMAKAPPGFVKSMVDTVPFPQRLGDPADYASLVLEMIRNKYLNGEVVRLDGALRMRSR